MSRASRAAAADFIENEKQFHLGFLPTEQAHPRTADLERRFKDSTLSGVACLQNVDHDVLKMAQKVLASEAFEKFAAAARETLARRGRIVFSGCGATGRLSILLESMWRSAAARYEKLAPYADCAASIMTGGDYALVRAVEFFEDYQSFGRRQTAELGVCEKDMFVAITEGGETSSVLGTLAEAADRKARCFLLFNNPADLLCEKLERSRLAVTDPRVTVLDLFCGPMALAGSTRMQATTSEQLIAGAMLETAAAEILGLPRPDFAAQFANVLARLEDAAGTIARFIDLEADCYGSGSRITYYADAYLLDIFTDTAERTPTFMLTPFKKADDTDAPEPWAMAKSPLYPTREVWQNCFRRGLRCITWGPEDYRELGGTAKMIADPPAIDEEEMLRFEVGSEPVPGRCDRPKDTAVLIGWNDEKELFEAFAKQAAPFPRREKMLFGLDIPDSPLGLMRHLAVKLFFNTLSTGTMVRLGRVSGNWMSFVAPTNKKLIDRSTRLIADLGHVDYQTACELLFEAMESPRDTSPIQLVLEKLASEKRE
ncbi:MAG: sugar phosphate isomerase [Lentisphaeria bacterium]|nr:sugar phosphate isomerase [Lentisphaeria bacterium]